MGPSYSCTGHPSNTISSGALKFYARFKRVTYKPIENCDFVDPHDRSWRSPYQTQNNLECLQIEMIKSTFKDTEIILSQISVQFQNKISLRLFISVLVMSLLPD